MRSNSFFWQQLPKPFFVLAPMEAVTDVVFRHVVARAGAPDVWFSEFTNATGWVHAGQKAIGGRLIKTDDEQPIVAQIWGGEPGDMERLAAHCRELGFHGIDINMGCPAKSAIKSGGSALIRKPDVAIAAIAAAKTAGLPVSVKTRLGYTYVGEWCEWLATLLRQDIVNLTIHLRTKKEMSKVPAHFELIPEIVALRDEIAPQTLLTINGDIRDRAHGEELAKQYPGIDGIMIGRGVFQNPFCFASLPAPLPSSPALADACSARRSLDVGPVTRSAPSFEKSEISSKAGAAPPSATRLETSRKDSDLNQDAAERSPEAILPRGDCGIDLMGDSSRTLDSSAGDTRGEKSAPRGTYSKDDCEHENIKERLITLMHYHLNLFDEWQSQLGRPYETLKRFFKIYIRDFDGAKELRDQLMHTKSTDEARALLRTISD